MQAVREDIFPDPDNGASATTVLLLWYIGGIKNAKDWEMQSADQFLELVIPRSLLRGQSILVPSGVWRTRGMMQSERERTVRGKSTTTLTFP